MNIENWLEKRLNRRNGIYEIPVGKLMPFSISELINWMRSRTRGKITVVEARLLYQNKVFAISFVKSLKEPNVYIEAHMLKGKTLKEFKKYDDYKDEAFVDIGDNDDVISIVMNGKLIFEEEKYELPLTVIENLFAVKIKDQIVAEKNMMARNKLIQNLVNIIELFPLSEYEEIFTDFDKLPLIVNDSGLKHRMHIKIITGKNTLRDKEVAKIIENKRNYLKQIRKMLNSYLIFYSYVNVISELSMNFNYSNQLSIDIIIVAETITNEEYAQTIGFYKNNINHICLNQVGSQQEKALQRAAKKLNVDISKIGQENICQYLLDYIEKLTWEDFQ